MQISKIKLVLKYLTGGVASVVEYLLDLLNDQLQKLPKDEVAKYAQLAADIATFIRNLCASLIKSDAKRKAAELTAQAFADLATALLDANLTSEELDALVEVAKIAVEAWKEAK